MEYKRILTIQDISCVGQCSGTVALPILSACGHEACILPTAILSTHTGGFQNPAIIHLADFAHQAGRHWQREGIMFDGIYTGYLGSVDAIRAAQVLAETVLSDGGMLIVDPAMADNGRLYRGFDAAYAEAMAAFCQKADIILPNMTEAAMLAGVPYQTDYDICYVNRIIECLPGKCVVMTGVDFSEQETGVMLHQDELRTRITHSRIPGSYHGTGDVFAACFTGALFCGKSVVKSAEIAAEYTKRCIQKTASDPAHPYGIRFEAELPNLLHLIEA